jgi:hypothetical protein
MGGRYLPLGPRSDGPGMGGRYQPLGPSSDGPGMGHIPPSRLPQNDAMDVEYGENRAGGTMGLPVADMEQDCTCGNCSREGHRLKVCVGPVDSYGYIPGCPEHNTKEHAMGDCPVLKKNTKRLVHYLKLRHCKPPLAGSVDPRTHEIPHKETLKGVRPWTPQWALEMRERDPSYWVRHEYRPFPYEENPEDPAWASEFGVPDMTDPRGSAGHLWKEKNRGSQGRDRSPRHNKPRDNQRRSRSRDRHRSRSPDRRQSRNQYRRRSRNRDLRRSRSPRGKGRPSRQIFRHQDSREVDQFPRTLTIDPTLPRQVMVSGMAAGPLVPPAQDGTLGNNTFGGSSVGAWTLVPPGGTLGNNTFGGSSVGAWTLVPPTQGGAFGNNTGGSSVGAPSTPQGSLLDRMGCAKCGQMGHTKEECPQRCRKCGSNGHKVEGCVSRNVCPCADWPGHVRWNCHLACLHCKDKRNYDGHRAMRCKRRCAVCGSWKHPSDDCRVQCDCARGGGYHLGQVHIDEDVDCGVCGRYYCPRHCRNCGGDFHSEASCGATVVEERIPNERKRVLQCPLQGHPTFKFGKRCAECDLEKQQRNDAATETEGETKVGFIKAESDGY